MATRTSIPISLLWAATLVAAPTAVYAEFDALGMFAENAAFSERSEAAGHGLLDEHTLYAPGSAQPGSLIAPAPSGPTALGTLEILARDGVPEGPPLKPQPAAGQASVVKPKSVAPATLPEYPVEVNERIRHFLDRFTGARRNLIGLWLERSGRYIGMIRDTLRRHGLPEDLAFTAMIESGFNPLAVSHAGAKGMWQFMAQTARRYGLRVDDWVDERLDPEKSTLAAAAYLRDLYRQFGSWVLAQAAYNAGEVKVAKAIQATRTTDFWALAKTPHLHDETKDFVPQIQAATMIGREPDRYGFELVGAHKPQPVESVRVPGSTDLRRLAEVARVDADVLRMLNPELLRAVTPPEAPYDLKVPEGKANVVRVAMVGLSRVKTTRASEPGTTHVVRAGDTLGGVAKRYHVGIADLRRWNDLGTKRAIRPGERLRVSPPRG